MENLEHKLQASLVPNKLQAEMLAYVKSLEDKIMELEQEIKCLRQRNKALEALEVKAYMQSWENNPDRMGGAFTGQEILDAATWR